MAIRVFGLPVLVASLTLATASANEDEAMAFCTSFAENNGVSDEPCDCIVGEVTGDAALLEEWYTLTTMDEYTTLASDELRAKVDPCVPSDVIE